MVYLTRPADDTSASLQAYLAGRGLIDVDASGKVIPRLNLVDGSGDPIGNFIADVGADKFFFAVKTSQTESEALMPILSFQIILQRMYLGRMIL